MNILKTNIKIVRAQSAGACYGVTRALDLAASACENCDSVCTLGEIIHNPIVVEDLEKQGVRVARDENDADGTVILRSHGVKPDVELNLQNKGCKIVDATCPHVKRAQRAAEKMAKDGRDVIVVGECGHPEVESIVAYATSNGVNVDVVSNESELAETYKKVGIVCQTTQKKDNFNAICEKVSKIASDVEIADTICLATDKRQIAARNLAQTSDVIIVLGGKNSSNTTRLFEICKDKCGHTYHIERPQDLPLSGIKKLIDSVDCEFTIGITAGASTPITLLEELEEYLQEKLIKSQNVQFLKS